MGITYQLVNITKREMIRFSHIPASKMIELAGNPVSASMVTWYLLNHLGDQITFVSTAEGIWPLSTGSIEDVAEFPDMTDKIVEDLIGKDILIDEGKDYYFEDDAEIYGRKLRNVWLK
jgi:hypothetical protein